MAAFGASPGTSKSQPATPAREGKGANTDVEAPKGDVHTGVTGKGHGGSKKGFGA